MFHTIFLSNKPSLVLFYEKYSMESNEAMHVLEDIKTEYKDSINIVKLNSVTDISLFTQFNITKIPTVIIFENKRPIGRVVYHINSPKILSYLNLKR